MTYDNLTYFLIIFVIFTFRFCGKLVRVNNALRIFRCKLSSLSRDKFLCCDWLKGLTSAIFLCYEHRFAHSQIVFDWFIGWRCNCQHSVSPFHIHFSPSLVQAPSEKLSKIGFFFQKLGESQFKVIQTNAFLRFGHAGGAFYQHTYAYAHRVCSALP